MKAGRVPAAAALSPGHGLGASVRGGCVHHHGACRQYCSGQPMSASLAGLSRPAIQSNTGL